MPTFREKIRELSGLAPGVFDLKVHLNAITGNGTPIPYKLDSEEAKASTISVDASPSLVSVESASINLQSIDSISSIQSSGAKSQSESGSGQT